LLNAIDILLETTETENREKALNELRNIIIEKHEIFDNYDMHDAQEFLQILLQNLAAECASIISKNPILKCPISETFQITSRLTRTCSNKNCKKETHPQKEYGFNLSLNVPDTPSGVQSCISSFFNESSMEKTCQLCSENIEHKQKTRLEKIPRVLIVHFQRLTPKWDEKTKQFQTDKKCTPIELSSSFSLKFVCEKGVGLEEVVKLNETETKYGIESIEQMKQWENKKISESTIVIDDHKKMLSLGPRAIQQLTEEQQLKLAMLKSMEEDEDDDDDIEISELDRLAASESDYLTVTVSTVILDTLLDLFGIYFRRQTCFIIIPV
jgi:hypothetical protein